jgi:hypothetical protein
MKAADAAGVTMVELLLVMTIFSGLLTVIYGVLISVQKQTADTTKRADSLDQVRLGLSEIDRQVRSGNVLYNPIFETLPMSMRVYTQANGQQRCVQWQIDSGVLRTRSWATNWQSNPATLVSDWRTIARNVVNTVSETPFALSGGGATEYGSRLVDVRILVKDPSAGGKPAEVVSSLSGRNTLYGFDPGVCDPVPPA